MQSELTARLGLEHPIILAPMGGGPSTPELVAAVSNAGGLGFLAAPYLTPDQISDAIRRTRALTSRPFGANLFAGGWSEQPAPDARRMLDLLARFHERLGIPPPAVPAVPPDPFPKQLEVVLDERPAAFSFTFGIPPPEALLRLRSRGILTFGTATTVGEAKLLAEAGVDGIVAQGAEAGGHRGTFAAKAEEALTPTVQLVGEVRRAVSLPIIATGGIMEGRELHAALQAGAAAAQLGTAFLGCPESGASLAYKHAIITASRGRTVLTRAFSGRWARGLSNEFIAAVEAEPDAILPYPLQNQLTRAMRLAATQKGDAECLSLWAGQGVARVRQLAAGELVRVLAEELRGAGLD